MSFSTACKIFSYHAKMFGLFLLSPLIFLFAAIGAMFILPILLCYPGAASRWLLVVRLGLLGCLLAPFISLFGEKLHLCRACHRLSHHDKDCQDFSPEKREMICSDCVYTADELFFDGEIKKF